MFKLLVTAQSHFNGTSIHQVVIDFDNQFDADVAYEKLVEKKRDVIKLY